MNSRYINPYIIRAKNISFFHILFTWDWSCTTTWKFLMKYFVNNEKSLKTFFAKRRETFIMLGYKAIKAVGAHQARIQTTATFALANLEKFTKSAPSGKRCDKSGKHWNKSGNRNILRRFISFFSCIRACWDKHHYDIIVVFITVFNIFHYISETHVL